MRFLAWAWLKYQTLQLRDCKVTMTHALDNSLCYTTYSHFVLVAYHPEG
jgi:hypothetical protein